MAKLQHTFVQGKMNKDLDERLVPNGQYRDAQNVQVSTSEGSDVGAVENILGNTKKNLRTAPSTMWPANFSLTNPVCIGVIKDSQNEKIYWFITADNGDAIAEFNQTTGIVAPILVDVGSILNFNKLNLITGVNILEGMLFWTDDLNEPRLINIATFKAGSTDFRTQTNVYSRPFKKSDITVIKLKPNTAPGHIAAPSNRAGSTNGTGITPVTTTGSFTSAVGGTQVPLAIGTSTTITTNVNANWQANDIIVLSASTINEQNYKIYFKVRATVTAINNASVTITIISLSQLLNGTQYIWECLLEEGDFMFNTSMPRFAYRWKYKDNMYSAFSPFTQAVFVPGVYNYEPQNAYNTAMTNNIRKLTINSFETPPPDVQSIDILYKDSDSAVVYKVDDVPANTTTFSITSELIYNAINSDQLIRPYDNVPRKAKAQELIGNRIVYGNYLQNYTTTTSPNISLTTTATSLTTPLSPQASVKSLRSYQVGIVYLDENGRETPVFTNDTATISIPKTVSGKSNVIKATSAQSTPFSEATHFKYYVKDISNEYYNLILDRYYDSDDGNIWLSFPSAERNKIEIDDFIILKKENNNNTAVSEDAKYKIIDISNEAPLSVRTRRVKKDRSEVTKGTAVNNEFAPINSGLSEFNFNGPTFSADRDFYSIWANSETTLYIQFTAIISGARKTSQIYQVSNGGFTGHSNTAYQVALTEAISSDDNFLDPGSLGSNTEYDIIVWQDEVFSSPAFEGKFFAKINRDAAFENAVIYNFTGRPGDYTSLFNLPVEDRILKAPVTPSTSIPTPNVPLTWWGWEENAGAQQRTELQAPTFGLKTMGLGIAPYWATGTGPGSQGDGYGSAATFVSNLQPGAVLRFTNQNNEQGAIYEVASVTTNTYTSREPGNTEPSVTFAIELTEPFTDQGTSFNIVKILQRKRDLNITFDEFTKPNSSPNAAIFETEPSESIDLELYYEATDAIPIGQLAATHTLPYFNCYSFGNGVESDRIRDDFNAKVIGKGVKVSSILEEDYTEERRGSGLIYSGIFNSTSGVNNLNQFIAGLKITKDLNPVYGTIQKLHARDTDLIALLEDKCFRILANKDALFNADGNSNVTSNNNVLGQTVPFVGEYGISKNPESFASFGFRAYFTDKARGAVMRLSRDGLTDISDKGMSFFFQDGLKTNVNPSIIGSYDSDAGSYNVVIGGEGVSFKEKVDGWNTRLSYDPEAGVSLNNEYYTFKNGELYEHAPYVDRNADPLVPVPRSNFYGAQKNTTVTPIFNDAPTSVKNFKTLSYEGDEGWTASITTNKQSGTVATWKEREGVYFNYIMGDATTLANIDTKEFSVQGIGKVKTAMPPSSRDMAIDGEINVSLQVGDVIYSSNGVVSPATIRTIGTVALVDRINNSIRLAANVAPLPPASNPVMPAVGDFMLFAKNSQMNTSGLLGYYGEVVFTTTSPNKKELFAVNSEIFISSE
jgi:hypothetical protein